MTRRPNTKASVVRAMWEHGSRDVGAIAKASGSTEVHVRQVLRAEFGSDVFGRPSTSSDQDRRILDLIMTSDMTAPEIAVEEGCDPDQVRSVSRRFGVSLSHRPLLIGLSVENMAWLKKQARAENVFLVEMLNAIVTDARLDEVQDA